MDNDSKLLRWKCSVVSSPCVSISQLLQYTDTCTPDVGSFVGLAVGYTLGTIVGSADGFSVGDVDGSDVGLFEGSVVGFMLGFMDGFCVGTGVGSFVGSECLWLILRTHKVLCMYAYLKLDCLSVLLLVPWLDIDLEMSTDWLSDPLSVLFMCPRVCA